MRDARKDYEGSTFAAEKAVATIYVIMLVAIVSMGVLATLDGRKPSEPGLESISASARAAPTVLTPVITQAQPPSPK